MIRRAADGDIARIQQIEVRANQLFREIGMDAVAECAPTARAELRRIVTDGTAWVACDDSDEPIGFLLLTLENAEAHIEQVSVLPRHTGQGVGRTLLGAAAVDAGRR